MATKSDFDNSRFLFCAPEALVVPKWREAIGDNEFSSRVVAVVVDEAHCVSKWYDLNLINKINI